MALSSFAGWSKKTVTSSCNSSCGSSGKPSACGAGDKKSVCGSSCGSGGKPSACGASK